MNKAIEHHATALALLALTLSVGTAHAVEHYTEARITQIETQEAAIYLFLEIVSGDPAPYGNGGSNEAINKPYLILASSAADVAARQHYLATALVALSNNTVVRFRWDDAGANATRVHTMLVRGQ